ncbi:hypothetical protein PGTUg99_014867 [Puccinia graminis f. sp. tritici]|uniref:Uncharacterized protein n=1 Tax=Puccinia graminis f. sp. tritici TaxID=56615 RepID=A0A5B0RLS1_PUCGR|nr:hypothetical protein PGTUg99_014867 [Puccinia graminis f. sp. tritici]
MLQQRHERRIGNPAFIPPPDGHGAPGNMPAGIENQAPDELVFDAIGLNPEGSDNGSEDEWLTVRDINDSSPFSGTDHTPGGTDDQIDWDNYLFEAMNQLSDEPISTDFLKRPTPSSENMSWYPFKNKEYLIASLFVGYMHHIMSREVYDQIRLILTLVAVRLPHWTTLQHSRESIRSMLNLKLRQKQTVWKQQCYALSVGQILSGEVSNPYVNPHVDFVPEAPGDSAIYKFSQSKKWLKELAPELRVQMIASRSKHYYIYEPALERTGRMVVPVFFYKSGSGMYAKCAIPEVVHTNFPPSVTIHIPQDLVFDSDALIDLNVLELDQPYPEIMFGNNRPLAELCSHRMLDLNDPPVAHNLPNPWRTKAQGKVIRHMPINLYADDTSGNVSKKWNRHISFYFTLAGLPPKLSNMQYNCHFLSTSNEAGVLELGEQIVEEINMLATDGRVAHDSSLGEDVLIMSMVLCFQADSPMHAEITNTPLPNVSLNPCRMCCLHTPTMEGKKTEKYVRDFLHIDAFGNHTENLWEIGKKGVKTHFDNETKEIGIRDSINRRFVEVMQRKDDVAAHDEVNELAQKDGDRLFNSFLKLKGFDGCQDTPVEILHVFLLGIVKYMTRDFMKSLKVKELEQVLASWQSFNIDSLNISSIQSKYLVEHFSSLVGKDFKIIIQTAPFVMYPFMSEPQRQHWISLGQLATYIFETRITNMKRYLVELRNQIDIFMWHSINMNAQWVNKPKFHMLQHLPESIERFGPACLFATEKFESFNSILRNASVHSNRHRPGRDLGLSFLNFHALRLVVSKAQLKNHTTGMSFHASDEVTKLFQNPLIQKSMGYNPMLVCPPQTFPVVMQSPLLTADKENVPSYFNQYTNARVKQISQLRLSEKDIVKKGYFVLVAPGGIVRDQFIGRVNSLWQIEWDNRTRYVMKTTTFQLGGVNMFYNMRILQNIHETRYASVFHGPTDRPPGGLALQKSDPTFR